MNYGALMLRALFEHWPQVNATNPDDEKPNSTTTSQVTNMHTTNTRKSDDVLFAVCSSRIANSSRYVATLR